jgi:hypothetical protein
MEKQTAVSWLVEKVNSDCLNSAFIRPELIDKAKEMEKEQIEQAFIDGDGGYSPDNGNIERMADDYYKINYNK